jgi:hypothetical protein
MAGTTPNANPLVSLFGFDTKIALGFHSEVWITLWKTDGRDHISPRKTDVL